MEHCFRALFTTSLGIALVLFPLYLLYRACEKRLAPKYANDLFGMAYVALWVFWCAKCVWLDASGLLPFGPAYAPEAALREAPAAGPGWLEVAAWVWLAGIAAYLLSHIVPYVRFRLRVRRESRPASAETQRAFDRLLGGVAVDTTENWQKYVRVLPGLPGPMSIVLWPKCLLLDREDYDDAALDAILRHELVHACGQNVAAHRFSWLLLGAIFWFVPTVWLFTREARLREEYTCDRDANAFSNKEELRAYARAITALAAPRRREAFGTANMACGAAALRCRVEALFREEAPSPWGRRTLRALLALVLILLLTLLPFFLFSGPARFDVNEGNILNFVGWDVFDLSNGMNPDSLPAVEGEGVLLYRMETKTSPLGSAALYNEMGDLYLSFPDDPAAADAACARLTERLTALLGEPVARRDITVIHVRDVDLRAMLELSPDTPAPRRETLATWRGTTDEGTATITLARIEGENGAVVGLV